MSHQKYTDMLGQADMLASHGRMDLAVKIWQKFLLVHPDYVPVLEQLAQGLVQLNRLPEAEAVARVLLERASGNGDAWILLGQILSQWGPESLIEAEECFHNAIARDSNNISAHISLGDFYLTQNRLMEAMASYQVAIDQDPENSSALIGLGEGWWRRNQQEQALRCFRQAFEFSRDRLEYVLHQREKGDVTPQMMATTAVEEAIYQFAELKYGLALLAQGHYLEGWPHFESRLAFFAPRQQPDLPVWDGTDLRNRQLLVIPEGGYSEIIQYCRLAGLVARAHPDATIWLRVPNEIKPLLETQDWTVSLLGEDDPFPSVVAWVPLLSIPSIMKMDIWDIPANVPYLHAVKGLSKNWRERTGDSISIVIAWHGNEDSYTDQKRAIPLKAFEPLAKLNHVKLISVQKGQGREELRNVSFSVADFNDELDEAGFAFVDTAAVIDNAALVITVDSAIAHLAGAMGKPVWVPVKEGYNNWRWAQRGRDTIWYPTMEIFQAEAHETWENLLQRLAKRLELMQSGVDPDALDASIQQNVPTAGTGTAVVV